MKEIIKNLLYIFIGILIIGLIFSIVMAIISLFIPILAIIGIITIVSLVIKKYRGNNFKNSDII